VILATEMQFVGRRILLWLSRRKVHGASAQHGSAQPKLFDAIQYEVQYWAIALGAGSNPSM
jgi:hypothetical protein